VQSDLCTSRPGHAAGAKGPALDCIIWSVVASMHCWITRVGALPFPMLALTCQPFHTRTVLGHNFGPTALICTFIKNNAKLMVR
jgi:hypothetical protein